MSPILLPGKLQTKEACHARKLFIDGSGSQTPGSIRVIWKTCQNTDRWAPPLTVYN